MNNTPCSIKPSIAQLVERWTVVGLQAEIHRSLVQIRLEGMFCILLCVRFWDNSYSYGNGLFNAKTKIILLVRLEMG